MPRNTESTLPSIAFRRRLLVRVKGSLQSSLLTSSVTSSTGVFCSRFVRSSSCYVSLQTTQYLMFCRPSSFIGSSATFPSDVLGPSATFSSSDVLWELLLRSLAAYFGPRLLYPYVTLMLHIPAIILGSFCYVIRRRSSSSIVSSVTVCRCVTLACILRQIQEHKLRPARMTCCVALTFVAEHPE